jgi:hypothetical protein
MTEPTTPGVEAGRRRYEREHGDPTTREYLAGEVASSRIERGRAQFAARSGRNTSARDALRDADEHDDGGSAA